MARVVLGRKPRPPWGLIIGSTLLLAATWIQFHSPHKSRPVAQETKTVHAPPVSLPLEEPQPASPPVTTVPFPLGESSGILWDLNTHQIVWMLHPHQTGPLASTTKLMTIYLALKRLPLGATVTISPQAAGTGGSDINMAPTNRFTVRQLLYALMLRSANDASVALAEAISGHTDRFVRLMNRQAAAFGMRSTHFADPDGLSPQSTGTAWDLSIIAMQDLENPIFRKIVATKLTALPHNPVVRNLNGLLFMDPSVIGLKSGWTTAAGFNLVFAATRQVNGRPVTLLGVVMHGQQGFGPEYTDAENLLNWGFSHLPGDPSGTS